MKKFDLGIIGLGVMGQNLLLNIESRGFSVAGFDKDKSKITHHAGQIFETADLQEFISALQSPKVILFMIPAGAAVDDVIEELLPHLSQGDILIDAGNSYFNP